MPLGMPQPSPRRVPSNPKPPPKPVNGGPGGTSISKASGKAPAPTAPLTPQNPGPAKFYPVGTPAPPPGPITFAPIAPGFKPPAANTMTVKNYGLDPQSWAAYNAMKSASDMQFNNANEVLDLDKNFLDIGFGHDKRDMGLNFDTNIALLNNSQYRDVDLARLGVDNNLAAAQRNRGFIQGFADRRFGDQRTAADGALGIDMRRLAQQLATGTRNATDAAAAAGAGSSTGFGNVLGDLNANNAIDQRAARLNYDSTMRGASFTRDQAIAGADNDWATSQADAGQRMKMIDSVAKDYGISRSQMEQAFKNGIERLGLDYGQATAKIAQARASNDDQAKAASDALLGQILMAAQQQKDQVAAMSVMSSAARN
jgi:hypothetical protein